MNYQFISVSLFFLCLFFIDDPGDDAARSVQAFWDLGHIFVFAIWSCLLVKWVRFFKDLKFLKLAAIILVLGLTVGVFIEVLQGRFHRTPSVEDVVSDIVGILVALAFLVRQRPGIDKYGRFFKIAVSVLVIWTLIPLTEAVRDEYAVRKSFPVLSDFETPLQITRWECKTGCSIVKGILPDGGKALKIPLKTTTLYSGVYLNHFPNDWRDYNFLAFNILNELDKPLEITCRIHDKRHRARGNKYKDRYNVKLLLYHGWNPIKISLADVASAPKGRKMDMSQISSVGLYVTDLKKEVNIYLDDVMLVK